MVNVLHVCLMSSNCCMQRYDDAIAALYNTSPAFYSITGPWSPLVHLPITHFQFCGWHNLSFGSLVFHICAPTMPSAILECQTLISFRCYLKTQILSVSLSFPQCTLVLFQDFGMPQYKSLTYFPTYFMTTSQGIVKRLMKDKVSLLIEFSIGDLANPE